MPFSNPIVAGATLVRTAMQSEGFATAADGTVSGWQISRDGSAVFTDVTIGGVKIRNLDQLKKAGFDVSVPVKFEP